MGFRPMPFVMYAEIHNTGDTNLVLTYLGVEL